MKYIVWLVWGSKGIGNARFCGMLISKWLLQPLGKVKSHLSTCSDVKKAELTNSSGFYSFFVSHTIPKVCCHGPMDLRENKPAFQTGWPTELFQGQLRLVRTFSRGLGDPWWFDSIQALSRYEFQTGLLMLPKFCCLAIRLCNQDFLDVVPDAFNTSQFNLTWLESDRSLEAAESKPDLPLV